MLRITGRSPIPNQQPWPGDYPSRNGGSSDASNPRFNRLVVVAYITAVSIPPVGFLLAIVVAARLGGRGRRHAALIGLLSIVTAAVWVLILTSGAVNTTNSDF